MADKTFGSSAGLTILAEDTTTPANGMVAHVTSSWNSGYQSGDIKGAFLSDTDDTDLVGNTIYTSDFSSTTDGWITEGAGSIAAVSSELELTGDGGYNDATRKALTTVVGKRYIVQGKFRRGTGATARVQIQEAFGSFVSKDSAETTSNTLVDFTLEFLATGTAYNLKLVDWTTGGGTHYITDVSVKLADADRSVNNNGLIVNGTVTRTPVETGADLVAYSGFSGSNYLEQPYNSDLDFGTGDFCVMGWANADTAINEAVLWREDVGAAGARFAVDFSARKLRFILESTVVTSVAEVANGGWVNFACIRSGSDVFIYLNGVLDQTGTNSSNLDNASAVTKIGVRQDNSSALVNGSLALIRISATAPTADQIAKIYNDEKVLFQGGAQATLYGSSDAVTALAHDPDTNLLHVGTSAGRSVFQGLARINNTTTSVTTAISAVNGIIGEQ
jgi:hypothetical protein